MINDTSALTVSLLLSDLEVTKKFSKLFRKIDIIPHYYEDLHSFWHGVLNSVPSLAIIDVVMMSDRELSLHNHPYIKNGQLPAAFYYIDANAPLLHSTSTFYNLGLINGDWPLSSQVKSILNRANKMIQIDSEVMDIKLKNDKLNLQINNLVTALQENREKDYCRAWTNDILNEFDKQRSLGEDFANICLNVFEQVDAFDKFTMLELSKNGLKLQSPTIVSDKFVHIPSIWLGEGNLDGVTYNSQNMASQVVADIMGSNIISINVKGTKKNPDILIYLDIGDELFLERTDWDLFERYLGGVYASSELAVKDITSERAKNLLSPWDLLAKLDEKFFTNSVPASGDFTLIDLDFSALINTITKFPKIRFYWNSFFSDYFGRMDTQLATDFKLVNMGVSNVGIVVSTDVLDDFFKDIKLYVKKFSYWRYFEDSDQLLTKDLFPVVRTVPPSSYAYLKYISIGKEPSAVGKVEIIEDKSPRIFIPRSQYTL